MPKWNTIFYSKGGEKHIGLKTFQETSAFPLSLILISFFKDPYKQIKGRFPFDWGIGVVASGSYILFYLHFNIELSKGELTSVNVLNIPMAFKDI